MFRLLVFLVTLSVRALRAFFRTREELMIENLALRQQVAALKKERPRPMLDDLDRAFLVAQRTSWAGWASRLFIVDPDTVARWHRDRFRRHWAKISLQKQAQDGLESIRRFDVLFLMAEDGWGAPHIHGELLKLGLFVSEMTVSGYLPHRPVDPDQMKRWIAFLRNHKDAITAMDFFTVPTAYLRMPICTSTSRPIPHRPG
jgi:hypothetical protein